jgi:Zn-dependent peptidase ImmA (M78 family)
MFPKINIAMKILDEKLKQKGTSLEKIYEEARKGIFINTSISGEEMNFSFGRELYFMLMEEYYNKKEQERINELERLGFFEDN